MLIGHQAQVHYSEIVIHNHQVSGFADKDALERDMSSWDADLDGDGEFSFSINKSFILFMGVKVTCTLIFNESKFVLGPAHV